MRDCLDTVLCSVRQKLDDVRTRHFCVSFVCRDNQIVKIPHPLLVPHATNDGDLFISKDALGITFCPFFDVLFEDMPASVLRMGEKQTFDLESIPASALESVLLWLMYYRYFNVLAGKTLLTKCKPDDKLIDALHIRDPVCKETSVFAAQYVQSLPFRDQVFVFEAATLLGLDYLKYEAAAVLIQPLLCSSRQVLQTMGASLMSSSMSCVNNDDTDDDMKQQQQQQQHPKADVVVMISNNT